MSNEVQAPDAQGPGPQVVDARARRNNRLVLLVFALICIAPVAASYLSYFVIKPEKRTNYGDLIEQSPVPALKATTLDGKPFDLSSLAGSWVMLSVDQSSCETECAKKLYEMRQIRLTTGKDRDRVQTLWFVTDDASVPKLVLDAYPNTIMLRAEAAALAAWLPAATTPADHIYLIDPHQHLMMRFPHDPDPYKVKRDLTKLLNASEIG
jgi:hypothetical protein